MIRRYMCFKMWNVDEIQKCLDGIPGTVDVIISQPNDYGDIYIYYETIS